MKNWRKHISLVILFSVGSFLIPGLASGCSKNSTKAEQSSCSASQTGKPEQKGDSCEQDNHSHDCSDKCTHDSCGCSAPVSSLNLPAELKTKSHFAETAKQQSGYRQDCCSPGYFSIWLPPKIG